MKSIFAIGAALGLAMMMTSVPQSAYAQRGINSGHCPSGTMSNNCTSRARNVSNCSAANYNRCTGGGGPRQVKGKR